MQKFRKVNNTCQKNTEQLAIHCPTIHSPIYAFLPSKKHSPIHIMALFSWFSEISGVKGWIFKCSQREGRECCFPPEFQQFYCVKACEINPSQSFCGPCEHLEKQAFTPKNYENQQKIRAVWRGEYFFREIKFVYTRAQEGANPCHGHGWGDCPHKSGSCLSYSPISFF